jgi:hypothetical protein
MAKITDPDFTRTRGIDTTNLKVVLYIGTASSTLIQVGYSTSSLLFRQEEWRTDNNLIKFPFPLLDYMVSNLN